MYDKYLSRKEITGDQLVAILRRTFTEFSQLTKKQLLVIVPMSSQVIAGSWRYVLEQHMYAADAIQIVSFQLEDCDFMLTADKKFVAICKRIGIDCYDVEHKDDQAKVLERLSAELT